MPKVVNGKRFLKSIRQSSHPFSPADHEHFVSLNTGDLFDSIKQHLSNGLPSERALGTDMVSTFLNTNRLKQLNANQLNDIVQKLGSLLADRAENVRYGTIDALCYLCSLSEDTCDILVNNNIIESIITFFTTYLLPFDLDQVKTTQINIYLDCFHLFTNICGVSSQSISILISSNKLIDILLKCLAISNIYENDACLQLTIVAVQFLTIISDESIAYTRIIQNESISNKLTELLSVLQSKSSSDLYLKSMIVSIAFNNNESNSKSLAPNKESLFQKLNPVFVSIFQEYNIEPTFNNFVEQIKQDLSSEMKSLQNMQDIFQEIKYYFLMKRSCFELLTNLTSDQEEEINQEDYFEEMDDEMIVENENQEQIKFDPLVQSFIENNNLINLLIKELTSLDSLNSDTVEKSLQNHVFGKDILSLIQTLKISSLTLIHNIINSKIAILNTEQISSIWSIVYKYTFNFALVTDQSNGQSDVNSSLKTDSIELSEEAINVVREILYNNKDITLNMADLEFLCNFANDSKNFSISSLTKVNIVRIMATVAVDLLSPKQQKMSTLDQSKQFIEQVTNLLLTAYHNQSNDLVMHAEILDSLIDIYSDDNSITTQVIKDSNLLAKLKDLALQYRKEMKSNPMIVRDNAVVSTVGLNLNRFIKYKQKIL